MSVQLFTVDQLRTKIEVLTTKLSDQLPKGYDSWDKVHERIDYIHEYYVDSLNAELNDLQESSNSVWDDIMELEYLETLLARFEEKIEIKQIDLFDSNDVKKSVFSWEEAVDFLKNNDISSYDVYFENGGHAGDRGINASAYLMQIMSSCGLYDGF